MNIKLLFRPGSLWIGAHWSPALRQWCVNLVPCVTLRIRLTRLSPLQKMEREGGPMPGEIWASKDKTPFLVTGISWNGAGEIMIEYQYKLSNDGYTFSLTRAMWDKRFTRVLP